MRGHNHNVENDLQVEIGDQWSLIEENKIFLLFGLGWVLNHQVSVLWAYLRPSIYSAHSESV